MTGDEIEQNPDDGRDGPRRPDLLAAVTAFVADARQAYLDLAGRRGYVPSVSREPMVREFASGFPYITQNAFSQVKDFKGVFVPTRRDASWIAYADWPSFAGLREVVESDERLRTYLLLEPRTTDEWRRTFDTMSVASVGLRIFDRLMHLHGDAFSEDQLDRVYRLVERALLDEELPVVFLAPIALTGFEVDEVRAIAANLHIVRIPEPLNLARMPEHRAGIAVNQLVLSGATHAVVLDHWTIPNHNALAVDAHEVDRYPSEPIDRVFHALRVATGFETGYGQICTVPLGWASRFRTTLPPVLTGAIVRRYPSHFEDGAWQEQRPVVTNDQLDEVARVHAALLDDRPSLALAAQRLSAAMLRDEEGDSVLDLLIGLEALLGDQTTTEATYKLAIRAAAVLSRLDDLAADPVDVFKSIKRVYGYRSAIAHGNQKQAAKTKMVSLASGDVPSVDVARDYLRRTIRALAARPDLSDGAAIDQALVLPALAAPPPS